MKKEFLSGNEAIALGAYKAGVRVAAAYPGTPSTEILENFSKFDGVYAEWSTNEKVAMEVAMGASYAGRRTMMSCKQVGLNVASDPFMAASITGVDGGLVVICADDPGIHSSQDEQDNRHYAKLAKIPMLEPSDSQEAFEFTACALGISEQFDTPVMVLTTTRVSHSKSIVDTYRVKKVIPRKAKFNHNVPKYVMLPLYARQRRPFIEERLLKLALFAETFAHNHFIKGKRDIGIITSGISYQYAREIFPDVTYLKLGMTYPLPVNLIRQFSEYVKTIIVIEELDPFLQENISALGIKVSGKEFIPRIGELDPLIIDQAACKAGWKDHPRYSLPAYPKAQLPARPPLLCPGCPHSAAYFVISTLAQRAKVINSAGTADNESKYIITGDIGCYTLGTYPPFRALDTTACMGAGIGQAIGMKKAGIEQKVIAVIGDSTFLHSGITGLIDAYYNAADITLVILDNGTTAMTGHQQHPGTGITARGEKTNSVKIEKIVAGIGIDQVQVVDAFNVKEVRKAIKKALDFIHISVVIVRGACAMLSPRNSSVMSIDQDECTRCQTCLKIGCAAIQKDGEAVFIETALCRGETCTICSQLCHQKAIHEINKD